MTPISFGEPRRRCGKRSGATGDPRDAVVTIDKTIPMQAGLGGGSADAAAALLALARLWGGAPVTLLRDVGVRRSAPMSRSSCPAGPRSGSGAARKSIPLVDLPPHWIVIVRPPFGVSTAEAYSWYDDDRAAGLKETRELQILPVPWPTPRGSDDQRSRAARRAPSS